MPYKIEVRDGKHCVVKESGGEPLGCHPTHGEAVSQMRAIYANEGKELTETEEKSYAETASGSYVEYYGATSFAELDEMEDAREVLSKTYELNSQFVMLAQNVLDNPLIEDKKEALTNLVAEYVTRLNEKDMGKEHKKENLFSRIKEEVKKFFNGDVKKEDTEPVDKSRFMVWKEESTGQWHWIARYSNKFRDNDNPPEIISEKSHKNFVEMVDKGECSYPELWLWHQPEYKFGVANWVAYDDNGFALAAGTVDKGKERIAEVLQTVDNIGVSHGMPTDMIVRDASDQSIINQHVTRELSPLPMWAAANKITGFVILNKENHDEEDEMPIPDKKKKALVEWGFDPDLLDELERTNAKAAEKAVSEGIEFKETETETEEVTPTDEKGTEEESVETEVGGNEQETEVAASEESKEDSTVEAGDTAKDAESEVSKEFPTREEVAEAFAAVVRPLVDQINQLQESAKQAREQFEAVSKELNDLKKADDEKVKEIAAGIPRASLQAMMATRSAIGAGETRVEAKDKLAKSKPVETKSETRDMRRPIGVPFLDKMIAGDSEEEE